MGPFVFRADAALTMRRRQDEEAQRALARAEEELLVARSLAQRAQAQLDDAARRAGQNDARGGDLTLAVWYRNWMKGQRCVVEARQAEVARCMERVALCRQTAVDARRRLRVIERLKARRWRDYQRETEREHQKVLDELGTLRHAIRQMGGKS